MGIIQHILISKIPMNRFIAALFAAVAFAEEEATGTMGDEEIATTKEKLNEVGEWFSSRQEPVGFTSIETAAPCKLTGNYHWYKNAGVDGAVIRHKVSECEIGEGAIVMTWAQVEDPDTPGNIEGHYCTIKFSQTNATARESADVETQAGTGVDYAAWNAVKRTDWCTPNQTPTPECTRQSVSQWQRLAADAQTNYPIYFNDATSKGEATCSAHRFLKTMNNYMELKTATPYKVTSGYKIYNSVADYDAETVSSHGAGSVNEFTLEAASALFAGAALLSATLLA